MMNDVGSLLCEAFSAAKLARVPTDSLQVMHYQRSRAWVASLADAFRNAYQTRTCIRVFSEHHTDNRADFRLNELVFDVCVCRVGFVSSAVHKTPLTYVKECLWAVESEFSRDSRQAVLDFNKLVLGEARCKLFIGPQVRDHNCFIEVLRPVAAACSGRVYLCLLPHPADWESCEPQRIQLWQFRAGKWREQRVPVIQ